jgi:hypothetical protein
MRSTKLITTAALVAACTAPATAVAQTQDLRSPDARAAAAEAEINGYQDLRSPDRREAQVSPYQDLRSPDARAAGSDVPTVQIPAPVVEVRGPSNGFDWGDAGIGAAGMLALLAIATGLTMGVAQARRRRGTQALAH